MKRTTKIEDLDTTGRIIDGEQLRRAAGGARSNGTYEPDVTYDGRQCRVDGYILVDEWV